MINITTLAFAPFVFVANALIAVASPHFTSPPVVATTRVPQHRCSVCCVYPPQLPSQENGPKSSQKRADFLHDLTQRCLKLEKLRWLRVVKPVLAERRYFVNSALKVGTQSAQISARMRSKHSVIPVVPVGYARHVDHQTEDNLLREIPTSSSSSVSHQRCC